VFVVGFFGFVCNFLVRINLSVALISMVNDTYVYEAEAAARALSVSVPKACPAANHSTRNSAKVRLTFLICCVSLQVINHHHHHRVYFRQLGPYYIISKR